MNSASLKSGLRNLAIKEKKPYDYIQMHYMIERLLDRVSVWENHQKYRPVEKGNSSECQYHRPLANQ